jgi:[lysine-biosynthesis-protein LysW]---L-2-aminoadipate ligase
VEAPDPAGVTVESSMEVVIAASRTGAEERRLYDAARAQRLPVRLCTVDECVSSRQPWSPETVVLNRVLGLTQALALAHLLEAEGVRSVNTAAVIQNCGNKVAATARLRAAGVDLPDTRIAFSPEAALTMIEEIGYPVVVKPIVGSWGRLLAKLNDRDAAEAVLGYQAALPSATNSVFYLQSFVGPPCRDLRAFVAGDQVICVVERRADHWIRNLSRHQWDRPLRARRRGRRRRGGCGGGLVGGPRRAAVRP